MDLSPSVPGMEVEGGGNFLPEEGLWRTFLPRQQLPRHLKPLTEQRIHFLCLSSSLLKLGRKCSPLVSLESFTSSFRMTDGCLESLSVHWTPEDWVVNPEGLSNLASLEPKVYLPEIEEEDVQNGGTESCLECLA